VHNAIDACILLADTVGGFRLVCYPHAPLAESVWSMRHELTADDASYLAIALVLEDSRLLTADGGLAARARAVLGTDRVTVTR
jgi:predicted nucleic acid-binding protein